MRQLRSFPLRPPRLIFNAELETRSLASCMGKPRFDIQATDDFVGHKSV